MEKGFKKEKSGTQIRLLLPDELHQKVRKLQAHKSLKTGGKYRFDDCLIEMVEAFPEPGVTV